MIIIIYGYARCSTDDQSVDYQRRELKLLGATDETIYFEYESGIKMNRVELNRLLSVVVPGDTIVATEVSRITRSTKQLIEILELVQSRKLKLVLGNFVVDCRTENISPMQEGMLLMMATFAQIERRMISQRVVLGMKAAAARGSHIGRSKTTIADIPLNFFKAYQLYKEKKINKRQIGRMTSLSHQTVYKYISIIEKSNT